MLEETAIPAVVDVGGETNQTHVFIFSIVGVGGLGKTTLAQFAFDNANVPEPFDFKVWICVSDEYKKEKIIKEMIMATASSKENTSIVLQSTTSMDALEQKLKDNVKDKRLLLVLDDVWSTNWTEILRLLQTSINLSAKIIVTTRENKNLELPVDCPPCKSKHLELKGLDDVEFKKLFGKHAFGTEDFLNHPKRAMLWPIGEEIANKLNGSPLAAKTVGATLRNSLEFDHWMNVQNSDLWNIGKQEPGDIMPTLMLSYLPLPTYLKMCFSYCAIFPKDHNFQKEDLVNMWMAQSYISCSSHNERPESAGRQHFEDLISRSFITQSMERENHYKMHHLLHDLARLVSNKECCVYHSKNWHEDSETCHHLFIPESMKLPGILTGQLSESLKLQLGHVRTLTIDRFDGASEILKSLKRVRVLKCISRMDIHKEFRLPDMGHLIHLRYIDLSTIMISKVSESICTLYHLQTLLFNAFQNISFPKNMCKLINLRHLVANSTSIASISSIEKLSQLQELEGFNCKVNNIRQLMKMTDLGGKLYIMNIDSVEKTDDAVKAELEKKWRLKQLILSWYTRDFVASTSATMLDSGASSEYHDNVLECLKPNEQLEELCIFNHPGCKPPSWMSQSSLKYIQRIMLFDCSNWRSLSVIAKLPSLKYLIMEGMSLVIELGIEDVFPSLVVLKLERVSLSFRKSRKVGVHGKMFPLLQEMGLDGCPEFEGMVMPSSLKDLTIRNLGFELSTFLKGFSSLTTLEINDRDRLVSFDREVIGSLSSLEKLTIHDMRLVIELGDEGVFPSLVELQLHQVSLSFKKSEEPAAVRRTIFPRLQKMGLYNCKRLEGMTMPPSLTNLDIMNSDVELPGILKGLSSLTTLVIYSQNRFTSFDKEVIDSLSSLKKLKIYVCENFRSLPEGGFPASLNSLKLHNCHRELHEKLRDRESPEWSMVQHILNKEAIIGISGL